MQHALCKGEIMDESDVVAVPVEPVKKPFPWALVIAFFIVFLVLVVFVSAYAGIVTIPGITPIKTPVNTTNDTVSDDDEFPPPLPDEV